MADRKLSRRHFLGLVAAAAASASAAHPSSPWARAVEPTARRRDGKHFVLIHGAWHGAWCWYKIVAGLEEAGQRATALDLPSGGIDGTPPSTVTLQAQATFLDSLSQPVVLVGHSAGGPVISMVAEARPQQVEKLVYLTAYLLPDGVPLALVSARDGQSLVTRHLVAHPDGTVEIDPAARRAVFYGDCDDRDVALAQSLLKPYGLAPAVAPVRVGNNFAGVRPALRDGAVDREQPLTLLLPPDGTASCPGEDRARLARAAVPRVEPSRLPLTGRPRRRRA